MTDQDIGVLWLYVGEMWNTFNIPADRDLRNVKMQAWQDNLGDLDQQTIRAALIALASHEFTPALGAIRDKALELVRKQAGEPDTPDADQAWTEVIELAGRGGTRPRFSHSAITQAVRAIGWDEIRHSETIAIQRGQFFRIYGEVSERAARQSSVPAPAVQRFLDSVPGIKRIGAAS